MKVFVFTLTAAILLLSSAVVAAHDSIHEREPLNLVNPEKFSLSKSLKIAARSHRPSNFGRTTWQTNEIVQELNINETAVVVVDMWDKHWCLTASQRVGELAEWINETLIAVRATGMKVIHAPSDCQAFYEGTPARERALAAPYTQPPVERDHPNPSQPVDDSDGGCDWSASIPGSPWFRENPLIYIDQSSDYIISDNKTEAYNVYSHLGLKNIIYMGVHLNMCVLDRSFAIKQVWKWGFNPLFNRDGIDAMYNPAMSPYVSHQQGVDLLVRFVETFWAPSISAYDLMDPTSYF